MLEVAINTPFITVVAGPDAITAPGDSALYLDGAPSGIAPNYVRQGSTQFLSVTFTPTSTGLYTLYAFGQIQFRVQCVPQLSYSIVTNLQDEALGSWSWDKSTGILTLYRQGGSVFATFNAQDTLTSASRERIS